MELPLSKSMAMRAIVLEWTKTGNIDASLAELCDDTRILARNLGDIYGSELDCGASGAALRFLTAIAAATSGTNCMITGSDRLCQRPVKPLVDALLSLGASIEYLGEEGYAPLRVRGRRLDGGDIAVDASQSSQAVSALMLAESRMTKPLNISYAGPVQSSPYIAMTKAMMAERRPTVERDWSAAAFWYEIAALSAGWVTLTGLTDKSLQGDRGIVELFGRLGVVTEFADGNAELSATPDLYNNLDADLADMPDAVPALVVTAVLAGIPFRLTGVGALHHKESDRIASLTDAMLKVGVMLETENYGNTLVWDGRRLPLTQLPVFDTYGDHRMAMALAGAAIFLPGIVVRDVEVVNKSYPGFWSDLQAAGFTLADPAENNLETE